MIFSWIKFGQCTGIGLLPSPPCPGQLAHGSGVWQICFGLGVYQRCPPSLEILSFTWTAVERVKLFVQRMRRTGKTEAVNKCILEHTCKTPPWRAAGMSEITRAVGLSCGADKRQKARTSPWNCTGETSQAPSYSPAWDGSWEVSPGEAHLCPVLLRPKLPNIPCGLGEVHAQWGADCAPKGSQLPLLPSEGSQNWLCFLVPGCSSEDVHVFF